jgi:hypothetical protein
MNEFKFSCPNCQQGIQATPDYAGAQITCPKCQATIVVPQPSDVPTGGAAKGKLTMAASTVQNITTSPVMAAAMVRNTKKPRIGLYVGWGVGAVAVVVAIILTPKALDKYHQHQADVAAAKAAAEAPPPPPPPPPDLEADEILQKLGETYKGFPSYSLQGISVGTVDSSLLNPALKEPQVVTTKLSLRLGRPEHYRMEWTRDVGKQHIQGAVWAADKGDFIHPGTITVRVKDREAALNTATISSGTLGTIIAALFFGDTNSAALALKNYAKTNNDTIDGKKCYVLTGKLGLRNLILWIRKADFVVAQTELVLGGKVDEATLAGLSNAQKNQMERASKLRGNFIETYQSIETNKMLNANDFETSFPPNAQALPMKRAPRAGRGDRGGPQ